MLTERQKKLLKDYGPRFIDRSSKMSTEFLHLAADAASVLTDEEWKQCAEAGTAFMTELYKVQNIVVKRLDEAKIPW